MALLLCMILTIISIVHGSLDEMEFDYGGQREQPDRQLMQDFYKRLAYIDLQGVRRSGDLEYDGNRFQPDYRADNIYGDDDNDEHDDGGDDDDGHGVDQIISDKSAIIRDPELTQHSSNLGIMEMSESEKQRIKPGSVAEKLKTVKSDEPLPFYCHPPNPCPKGYTSKDNCQEFIEDTAEYQKEWIQQMQKKGICSCDEEHMFDCTTEAESLVIGSKEDMDTFFNNFIKEKEQTNSASHQENPFTQKGQKRISLVAKKSPRVKRDNKFVFMDQEMDKMMEQSSSNPYLAGKKLPTVAKKGVIKREG